MRVAIIQSSYIPWKGYFDIIHDVDHFIFLDDVQFTARDWRTRNRIKTATGPAWLSIPAGARRNRTIDEVVLSEADWQKKHWNTISRAYARATHFHQYRSVIEEIYLNNRWTSLSNFNQRMTEIVAKQILGIDCHFHDAREFNCKSSKLDKIIGLLKSIGASAYVSGPSAASYIEPHRFSEAGIELIFKDYSGYPEYSQLHPPFVHGVSILDLIFNVGAAAPAYIWGWREQVNRPLHYSTPTE